MGWCQSGQDPQFQSDLAHRAGGVAMPLAGISGDETQVAIHRVFMGSVDLGVGGVGGLSGTLRDRETGMSSGL